MTSTARPIDAELLNRFAAIVGDRYALRDAADIAPYVKEHRNLWLGSTPLVLRPGSVEEVSAIMRLATETGTPIVPQSGNTGLVGGGVPDESGGELLLSLSRLNRIREIDPVGNTITVEAGVVLQTLQQAADEADRLFPLSMGSQGSCQIGGNLSTNAGGTGVLAYGNTRDLCLGLEVVMPTGEVFDDLRKLKKDNTGYDLKNLFVGAEGTLGVITAAVLKLFPKPRGREVGWAALSDPQAALALFGRATDKAGGSLTAFELIGRNAVDFTVRNVPNSHRPVQGDWPWHLLVEISSNRSAEDARELLETVLGDGLENELIGDAVIASSLGQASDFWRLRESISESQKPEGASIKHDISVPVEHVPEFIARAADIVEEVCPGARVVCFGHMGDGNLHYNVSQPVGMEAKAYLALYPAMNGGVHALVRDLGGSFSAEHGIGRMKRKELLATQSPLATDLMRRVKAAFDPAGIMNPGRVI